MGLDVGAVSKELDCILSYRDTLLARNRNGSDNVSTNMIQQAQRLSALNCRGSGCGKTAVLNEVMIHALGINYDQQHLSLIPKNHETHITAVADSVNANAALSPADSFWTIEMKTVSVGRACCDARNGDTQEDDSG